jgi:hypothetical protein
MHRGGRGAPRAPALCGWRIPTKRLPETEITTAFLGHDGAAAWKPIEPSWAHRVRGSAVPWTQLSCYIGDGLEPVART